MNVGELKAALIAANDDRIVTVGWVDTDDTFHVWCTVGAIALTQVGVDCLEIRVQEPWNIKQ